MKLRLFITLIGIILLFPSVLWAKSMWVTDQGIDSVVILQEIGSNRTAGLVKFGEYVEVLEVDRNWSKIRTSKGAMGWIGNRSLTEQYPDMCREELKKIKETQHDLETKNLNLTMENERLLKELEEAKQIAQTHRLRKSNKQTKGSQTEKKGKLKPNKKEAPSKQTRDKKVSPI